MSLESNFVQTLIVTHPAGVLELPMETWAGGNLTSPDTKHRNAVTGKKTYRGGKTTRNNVTLTRECDAQMWAAKRVLESVEGRPGTTVAVRLLTDGGGTVLAESERVTGGLMEVNYPDSNIDGEAVGMVSIVVGADE